ncbi:MAG TPA: rhamnogalacturonan lyase, partial [Herpetosiphonaceae bacterium]|nr:rhamnogalacturonan lyase [Herpetosiphonaceae bacterium]
LGKWDYENGRLSNLLTADGTYSSNSTKGNPSLQADILGDWREEVLWRTEDSSALRLYTTPYVTEHRFVSLMHDSVYRTGIAIQNVGYNHGAALR